MLVVIVVVFMLTIIVDVVVIVVVAVVVLQRCLEIAMFSGVASVAAAAEELLCRPPLSCPML